MSVANCLFLDIAKGAGVVRSLYSEVKTGVDNNTEALAGINETIFNNGETMDATNVLLNTSIPDELLLKQDELEALGGNIVYSTENIVSYNPVVPDPVFPSNALVPLQVLDSIGGMDFGTYIITATYIVSAGVNNIEEITLYILDSNDDVVQSITYFDNDDNNYYVSYTFTIELTETIPELFIVMKTITKDAGEWWILPNESLTSAIAPFYVGLGISVVKVN
jgi:hypothetical protein